MKKLFLIFTFCAVWPIFCNSGCFAAAKTRILASTFPVYLFTANVCAGIDNVDVSLLIPASAGCPHDFTLRPQDVARLSKADILVINGDGLEDFLEKMLTGAHEGLKIIDAGKGVPTLEAQAEHDHGHDHGDHSHAINPHIFAAPGQAALMVANIAENLAVLNPENAEKYQENGKKYAQKLEKLAERFKNLGQDAKNRRIALGHDSLAYMAHDAGLEVVAIFEGTDSVARLASLKKLFDSEKPALLAGDAQYPDKLLTALGRETGLPTALLNPCASGPENAPLDYYEKEMEQNLETLEAHFGK